jgi:hypothetical protein
MKPYGPERYDHQSRIDPVSHYEVGEDQQVEENQDRLEKRSPRIHGEILSDG